MTKKQYEVSCERIEELLQVVGNETSMNDKNFIELDFLSDLVADYEEKHFPIETPTLQEFIKLRMFEINISQVKLSEIF
ncbi:XRE family transcriptional regulator [Kaistella sp.]|uniref:XRE family transcriptional regulator n=1 Tax=Kaistella sp. TaxID=2782235 RepID=UPI0035A0736C